MSTPPPRDVARADVDAAVRRPGASAPNDPALAALASARVLLRLNAAVGPRQAHSDLGLEPGRGVAARYGRIGDSVAETARIEETDAAGLETLIIESLPDDAVLRAPAALTGPGHPVFTLSESVTTLLADPRLTAGQRAQQLADAGEEPAVIDIACHERARVSVSLQVRSAPDSAEPDTAWAGMWVLGAADLYALRSQHAGDGTGRAAFQAVAPGDVLQQILDRVSSSFHYLGALEREQGPEHAGGAEAR